MKQLISLAFGMLMSISLIAQDPDNLYLVFEFMRVDETHAQDYWDVEEFWSRIHNQRVNAGEIAGWDLWSLQPGGEDQGYQFMTVTLYNSFQKMIEGEFDFVKHAKMAYPKMSEDELMGMMATTVKSRDLARRLYLRQIDHTDDEFNMPIGTFATIDFMHALDEDYEELETTIFKPFHQEMVNESHKGSWGLLRVIFPAGSDRYASHITVNMYRDTEQYATWGGPGGDMDMLSSLAIEHALSSRDMKKVLMARLEMKVRSGNQ